MIELELLTILNNVRGEYILEAQELRSRQRKQPLRRMHRKRIFLIAAIVSLLLLLVGCAAVLISLQKVSLGHMKFTDSWEETFGKDVISLHGYMDSPEYQAVLDWMEFENSHNPDPPFCIKQMPITICRHRTTKPIPATQRKCAASLLQEKSIKENGHNFTHFCVIKNSKKIFIYV